MTNDEVVRLGERIDALGDKLFVKLESLTTSINNNINVTGVVEEKVKSLDYAVKRCDAAKAELYNTRNEHDKIIVKIMTKLEEFEADRGEDKESRKVFWSYVFSIIATCGVLTKFVSDFFIRKN